MKRLKKSLLIAGAVASVGIGSVGIVGAASAATNTDPGSSLIDKLASKFNLNKDEVKAVFEEDRASHEAERLADLKDKLATAVTEGKLTQAQSDKILAKITELQEAREAKRDSMRDMTDEERRAAMDSEHDALKQWISDNGIPEAYARFIGMGGHRGPGGPGGAMGPTIIDSSTN